MGQRKEESGRTQADHRRTLRSPLIVLQARQDAGRSTFFGYAKNISRGGMFIASINPAVPGSRFSVEFPLPGRRETRVQCQCEVVWHRPFSKRGIYEPGMGLRFIDLPVDSGLAIDTWANAPD